MANISIHGSHNGGVVVEDKGEIIVVIEFERFFNSKNSGISQYKTHRYPMIAMEQILVWIEKTYGYKKFENCYFSSSDFIGEDKNRVHRIHQLIDMIDAENKIHCWHHESHAYNVFYQSPYQEGLIFSFDGGGDDGKFNIYLAKRGEKIQRLEQVVNPVLGSPHIYYDLGFPYMIFGQYCGDIKEEWIADGNLVWPGKLMGLAPYGNIREEWLPHFLEFYKSNPDGTNEDYQKKLDKLGSLIGVEFNIQNKLTGQVEYDVAATAQRAFEDAFLEVAVPYFEKYPNLPILIAGGCGLNITLNTRIMEEFQKEVFVGPNPSDCGLAVGHILKHIKPETASDITYKGLPILDEDLFAEYIGNYPVVKKVMDFDEHYHYFEQIPFDSIIQDIVDGKIVGVVQGNSEHGPRALGNRSIICNPTILEMKDILNAKVKNREWYRPFAPIVRAEDVSEYFNFSGESRWMTFSPKVKPEWIDKLPAITHVDGSSRVQTVTEEQNPLIYKILTKFKEKTGVGVLVNTSFNVNGKPILSTYRDAFEIYTKTQLDSLLLNGFYIKKEQ
jgi:carbamoyltransferase